MPFAIHRQDRHWLIDASLLFGAVVDDLRRKVGTETISRRFHNGLVDTLVRLSRLLREESSIHQICLSGGTFNNSLVFEQLICKLESDEFKVFTHSEVPTGDGGLSLGPILEPRAISRCWETCGPSRAVALDVTYKLHRAKCARCRRKDGPGNCDPPGHLSRQKIYAPTCFTSGTVLISTLRGKAATVIGAVISSTPL